MAGITTSLAPNRTSGVAPLAVFFDASLTTGLASVRPLHDFQFVWDYGDAAAGTWQRGSRSGASSKNLSAGHVAAHVFETPGTYDVCLNVFDGTNTAQHHQQITVHDPNGGSGFPSTLCVHPTTMPTTLDGCPTGATTTVNSDFDAVINNNTATTANRGVNFKRILFRRGQNFTSTSGGGELSASGPGMVGAYGSGSGPAIVTGTGSKLIVGTCIGGGCPPFNLAFSDWRVVDLRFNGVDRNFDGMRFQGPATHILFLRVEVQNADIGLHLSDFFLNQINTAIGPFTVEPWSDLTIVDSFFDNNNNYNYLGHTNRYTVMGTLSQTSSGPIDVTGHSWRLGYAEGAVLSNNDFLGGTVRQGNALTIRSIPFAASTPPFVGLYSPGSFTRNVVVSDNLITNSTVGFFTIAASNSTDDARFRDIIVERNWVRAFSSVSRFLTSEAPELTVRNNLFQVVAGTVGNGMLLTTNASAAPYTNISILNNTFFSAGAGGFAFVSSGLNPTNLRVMNNLLFTPNLGGGANAFNGVAGGGSVIVPNLTTCDPGFGAVPPTTPVHFTPSNACALGTGAAVPVWLDFFANPRTLPLFDFGAIDVP